MWLPRQSDRRLYIFRGEGCISANCKCKYVDLALVSTEDEVGHIGDLCISYWNVHTGKKAVGEPQQLGCAEPKCWNENVCCRLKKIWESSSHFQADGTVDAQEYTSKSPFSAFRGLAKACKEAKLEEDELAARTKRSS